MTIYTLVLVILLQGETTTHQLADRLSLEKCIAQSEFVGTQFRQDLDKLEGYTIFCIPTHLGRTVL